jgi:hypothetical protein
MGAKEFNIIIFYGGSSEHYSYTQKPRRNGNSLPDRYDL